MEDNILDTSLTSEVTYTDLGTQPCANVNHSEEDSSFGDVCFLESDTLEVKRTPQQEHVVSVFDVAVYVMGRIKECTTMKLHKLLYYCQAWTLVWDERPLFRENIEAWANGPVIRELFNFHRGMFIIKDRDMTIGNESVLSEHQRSNINEVLDFYGDKTSQWLIDQTHIETPWIEARKGLDQTERGNRIIENDAMYQFYSSLK